MLGRGLTEKDRETLAKAGASPALVEAVAAEALTMRWLFMLRIWGMTIIGALSIAVSVWLFAAFDLDGWRAALASALAPSMVGLLTVVSKLEANAVRSESPVRWAARRLAVMAVEASQPWNDPGGADTAELARLTAAGSDFQDPRSALREIARAMERPRPGKPGEHQS